MAAALGDHRPGQEQPVSAAPAMTLPQAWLARCRAQPAQVALRHKRRGIWRPVLGRVLRPGAGHRAGARPPRAAARGGGVDHLGEPARMALCRHGGPGDGPGQPRRLPDLLGRPRRPPPGRRRHAGGLRRERGAGGQGAGLGRAAAAAGAGGRLRRRWRAGAGRSQGDQPRGLRGGRRCGAGRALRGPHRGRAGRRHRLPRRHRGHHRHTAAGGLLARGGAAPGGRDAGGAGRTRGRSQPVLRAPGQRGRAHLLGAAAGARPRPGAFPGEPGHGGQRPARGRAALGACAAALLGEAAGAHRERGAAQRAARAPALSPQRRRPGRRLAGAGSAAAGAPLAGPGAGAPAVQRRRAGGPGAGAVVRAIGVPLVDLYESAETCGPCLLAPSVARIAADGELQLRPVAALAGYWRAGRAAAARADARWLAAHRRPRAGGRGRPAARGRAAVGVLRHGLGRARGAGRHRGGAAGQQLHRRRDAGGRTAQPLRLPAWRWKRTAC